MAFLASLGHDVTGIDRAPEAVEASARFGKTVLADVEGGPWPLVRSARSADSADPAVSNQNGQPAQFDVVVVTNYLWRPLFPVIQQSLASEGVLIYETFSAGNETVGKPSRPDFLLQDGELLRAFAALRVVAYECGFIESPARFVQRLVAVNDNRLRALRL